MKRSCKGCKAMQEIGVTAYKCEFDYKTDSFGKPLEDCPKPKTYDTYVKLLKNKELIKTSNDDNLKKFTKDLIKLNELLWNAVCLAEELFSSNGYYHKITNHLDDNRKDLVMKAIAYNFNKFEKNDERLIRDSSENLYIDNFTELAYDLNEILDNFID